MHRIMIFLTAFLLVSLWFAPILAVTPVQAEQRGMELTPTADSYVASEGPQWNHGRESGLRVQWSNISGEEILAFLKFDLAEIPSGAIIDEAKLRLYSVDVTNTVVSAHYCSNNDWTEDGISYNNKPSFDAAPLDTVEVTSVETWNEWNVTERVRFTFEGSDKRLSLVLKADASGGVVFNSRNAPYATSPYHETRPYLYVLYQPPPPSIDNTALIILIVIIAAGATAGLGATYMLRKRRKPHAPNRVLQVLQGQHQSRYQQC